MTPSSEADSLNARCLTLDCTGQLTGQYKRQVNVRFCYYNRRVDQYETKGTLHVTDTQLIALIESLRAGGMKITLTGKYVDLHPELHAVGT